MSVESDLFAGLTSLVAGRVYPDVAPAGAALPYITYQQVGGDVISFIDTTLASQRNARFQLSVWDATRQGASTLMRQVESALITSATLRATALGSAVATYDDETQRRGARQFFSIWFDA
jgi:hypothetical protein